MKRSTVAALVLVAGLALTACQPAAWPCPKGGSACCDLRACN